MEELQSQARVEAETNLSQEADTALQQAESKFTFEEDGDLLTDKQVANAFAHNYKDVRDIPNKIGRDARRELRNRKRTTDNHQKSQTRNRYHKQNPDPLVENNNNQAPVNLLKLHRIQGQLPEIWKEAL